MEHDRPCPSRLSSSSASRDRCQIIERSAMARSPRARATSAFCAALLEHLSVRRTAHDPAWSAASRGGWTGLGPALRMTPRSRRSIAASVAAAEQRRVGRRVRRSPRRARPRRGRIREDRSSELVPRAVGAVHRNTSRLADRHQPGATRPESPAIGSALRREYWSDAAHIVMRGRQYRDRSRGHVDAGKILAVSEIPGSRACSSPGSRNVRDVGDVVPLRPAAAALAISISIARRPRRARRDPLNSARSAP